MACLRDLGCNFKAISSIVEEPFVTDKYKNRLDVPKTKIKVVGLLTTLAYQRARLIAEKIHHHLPFRFSVPEIRAMLQIDWHQYLQKMRPRIGGDIWKSTRQVLIFVNETYIGNDKDFVDYITQSYELRLPVKAGFYQNLITQECRQLIEGSGRSYVYFTFTIDNLTIGSFLFMLYSDLLPATCKNFLNLCIGDSGETEDGVCLHYKNTLVHRIVKNGWLQSGDIEFLRGGGGVAANGGVLPDEAYCVPHDRQGVLSMANNGRDSNGSQFLVSLKANPWMDHYYVAFGQLVDGIETLKKIEQVPTSYEQPLKRIVISRCGEYFFGEEPELEAGPDVFIKHHSQISIQPEGECLIPCSYLYSGFPGIAPWLDNIVDKLDDRDTISLLMAERYLGGLYSLATDYLPGMDMLPQETRREKAGPKFNLDMSRICPLCESGGSKDFCFNFDETNEEEKISLICGVGKEIVACALLGCSDEAYTECILMDSTSTAQWVLELACEIAAAALTRAKKIERGEAGDSEHQIEATLSKEAQKIAAGLVTPDGISLVAEILKEALLHAVEVGKDFKDSEPASEALEG